MSENVDMRSEDQDLCITGRLADEFVHSEADSKKKPKA